MAEYGMTGGGRRTDEYGNPAYSATDVDEYGKPIQSSGTAVGHGGVTGGGLTGTRVTDVGVGTGGHEQLRRSGSSSSSSSEEDEHGVRRKKGLKEKVKEKLPGTHKDTTGETGHAGYGTGQDHEKKGMMEKIKEKLPGGGGGGVHKETTPGHDAPAGTLGAGYGGTHGTEYGATGHEHDKKGMMEKIKEKLPGTHKD